MGRGIESIPANVKNPSSYLGRVTRVCVLWDAGVAQPDSRPLCYLQVTVGGCQISKWADLRRPCSARGNNRE